MNDFSTRGPDKVFRFENEEPGGDFGPLGFLVLWVYPGASRRERRCAAPLRGKKNVRKFSTNFQNFQKLFDEIFRTTFFRRRTHFSLTFFVGESRWKVRQGA